MRQKPLTVLDQIASSDKVRRKIVDAASTLYAQKGYTATSIEEISERAGVSLPVTYHYVKKKSEIMKMIMEDMLRAFKEELLKEIKAGHDPVDKLSIAVRLYFRITHQSSDKVLLMYQKSGSLDGEAKSRIMQLEVELSEIFSGIVSEGIQKGLFKDVDLDLMSYDIIMMAHMWILKRWHFKNRLSLDIYTDQQLAIILDALLR
ncbi:MAG: TetR/AcrR family transcriptional regulator [Deltaproteobacteria bacterium]|nr:TetR/AcrR family transcriptional regulator [Deltaproteobacteria bacterium]MBW2138808.1 TetR/AcrR family transcriptional regulator [Deltaproteobacteria bacterium]